MKFPVHIQADNENAEKSQCAAMCHTFDLETTRAVFNALTRTYRYVSAWDANGNIVSRYPFQFDPPTWNPTK